MTNENTPQPSPLADPLEAPMQNVPGRREYAIPQHVLDTDKALTEQDRRERVTEELHAGQVARLEALLAEARQVREHAAAKAAEWQEVVQEAEGAVRRLSELLAAVRGEGVPEVEVSEVRPAAVRSAAPGLPEFFLGVREGHGDHFLAAAGQAPVNAVDIRTAEEYAKGMTHIELSEQAKTAIEAAGSDRIGIVLTDASPAVLKELQGKGVIGRNGGLTIKGSALAAKLQSAYLDRMF